MKTTDWGIMGSKKTNLRKMKNIVLVPHNDVWRQIYEHEARRLAQVFGPEMVSIHHAGSTSIQGIMAKPVVDFLIIVRNINKIDEYDEKMIETGYEANGETGIPGRRFFSKIVGDVRVYNVHVFEIGHPEIERMLDFRDYLRAHPEEALAYSRLKEELANQYPKDIDRYTAGKSNFINDIVRRARAWRLAVGQLEISRPRADGDAPIPNEQQNSLLS
jgi:GrpB-like predicted nucleotidyltransferase (UPF0157 family)